MADNEKHPQNSQPSPEQQPSKDVESQRPTRIPLFKQIIDQQVVTPEIINAEYKGSGTEEDPYIVQWIEDDPRNPMLYANWFKWSLTQMVAWATLAVSFVSSAYAGGIEEIVKQFKCSNEVATLGISLFVLGFAIGPLIWAPMSELYGRQVLFFGTYAMLTFFNAGTTASQNIWTLIILRFLAGSFGSSPLTNAGGVIADIFQAEQRGIALSLFAAAPFMGPVLGPIIGGFVGETIGWRWLEGIMAIFTGVLWIMGAFTIPETYAPVLLRQRAKKLSKLTGKVYLSKMDAEQGKVTVAQAYKTALTRPWILLLREPIVALLSIYMAIIYGTLYMMFGAFPIVYQETRGWSQGIGGLPFLGVAVGMLSAVAYSIWDNKRYIRVQQNDPNGYAPPEARLPPAMIGGVAIPIGLFWFAWTNGPSVHWMVSIAAAVPFGFGMVLVFLSIMNYLIDAYTIFAASVLAANSVLRSSFGAIFPLFTTYMYDGLGIHWASTIPAFLALACMPFPFLFYKYGPAIRKRCKFAAEAERFMKEMRERYDSDSDNEDESAGNNEGSPSGSIEKKESISSGREEIDTSETAEAMSPDVEYNYDDPSTHYASIRPGMHRVKTLGSASGRSSKSSRHYIYEENPFDLDRVHTRESFGPTVRSRSSSRPASISSGRK